MARHSIYELAYYLVLIGGILLVVFTILGLIGFAIGLPFGSVLGGMSFGFALLPLIIGIIAIFVAKKSGQLVWAIVLIVAGYVAGGLGGLLVLIGGIVGLLSGFVR
jgi:hypothetical protein